MSAFRRRTCEQAFIALLWAVMGGGLIGGAFSMLDLTSFGRIAEEPWLIILGPIFIGALSLFIVVPCTMVFGLPSVALINHLELTRWPALAVCVTTATATQIACVWLVFWNEYSAPSDFLFTTPFAMGAAITLWWRMTREL